jgi:membrane protein DedA with SNARE-associated domain
MFSGGITFFPEEIILLVAGYASSIGFFDFTYVAITCIAALVTSDIILFRLARARSPKIQRLRRYAKRLFIMSNPLVADLNPRIVIFLAKFLPFVRFVGPFYAGIHNIKMNMFIAYSTLATVIYVLVFTSIGYIFNSELLTIVSKIENVRHGIFIFLMSIIGFVSVIYLHRVVDRIIDKNGDNGND